MQFLIGFALSGLIGLLSLRMRALSPNGAVAAFITGGLIFGFGGIAWGVLLVTFFITSSVLSKAFTRRKAAFNEKFAKGSQRDWGQVLANGGLGAVLALVLAFFPKEPAIWLAFAGAMAAVNADTWSTELGVLSSTPPRLVSNWKVVERGTSGGVSLLGTASALAGAALIGLLTAAFTREGGFWLVWGSVTLGGLAGALFDSCLGATVQAIYHCPTCQKETERHPRHSCGTPTAQVRGWRWLNNDMVNFACSSMGALVALLVWLIAL